MALTNLRAQCLLAIVIACAIWDPMLAVVTQLVPSQDEPGECLEEGNLVVYSCTGRGELINRNSSTVVWRGGALRHCMSDSGTVNNGRITLPVRYAYYNGRLEVATNCSNRTIYTTLKIIQAENLGQYRFISNISFIADTSMNDEHIRCFASQELEGRRRLRVGDKPEPPTNVTLSLSENTHLSWKRPIYPWYAVAGNIRGYLVNCTGDCGVCNIPESRRHISNETFIVSNDTFNVLCTGWVLNTGTFGVRTITADCGFQSDVAEVSKIFDNTIPVINATSHCEDDNLLITIQWEFTRPEVEDPTHFSLQVHGFKVTFTDKYGNTSTSELLNPTDRSYVANLSLLYLKTDRDGFNLTVTVITDEDHLTSAPLQLTAAADHCEPVSGGGLIHYGDIVGIILAAMAVCILGIMVRDAGIPEMLDADDMCAIKIPDSKSIMTFLVTIYQHFN